MLRTIIFAIFIYIIYRIVKNLVTLLSKPKNKKEPYVSQDRSESAARSINQNDIIEADFEDLPPESSDAVSEEKSE